MGFTHLVVGNQKQFQELLLFGVGTLGASLSSNSQGGIWLLALMFNNFPLLGAALSTHEGFFYPNYFKNTFLVCL